MLSAFLDRVDGELARIGNMMTPGGHRYDYLVDNGVNGLFFLAIGIGLRHASLFGHDLGHWPIALGVLSSGALLLLCNWMSEIYETHAAGEQRIYEGAWGFHLDDALYLLGPARLARLAAADPARRGGGDQPDGGDHRHPAASSVPSRSRRHTLKAG